MSERISVCRGTLSPFVENKLSLIFRNLKAFMVPIPAKRSQIRPQSGFQSALPASSQKNARASGGFDHRERLAVHILRFAAPGLP
jgi:hypothetical protein